MYVLTTSSIIAKSNLNAKTSSIGTWKIVVAPADLILVKIVQKKSGQYTLCNSFKICREKLCQLALSADSFAHFGRNGEQATLIPLDTTTYYNLLLATNRTLLLNTL